MTEIQGKPILVWVSVRFELARVWVIGSQLYNFVRGFRRAYKWRGLYLGGGGRVGGAYNWTKKSVSKRATLSFFLIHQPKYARHANDHAHDWRCETGEAQKRETTREARENGLSPSSDFFGIKTEVLIGQACETCLNDREFPSFLFNT